MSRRLKIQLKGPSTRRTDEEERLLPAIELQEYPIDDAITNASRPVYNPSKLKPTFQICSHRTLSFDRLRRILNIEKIGSSVNDRQCRPRRKVGSQRVILHDSEEPECCDREETFSETLFEKVQRKGGSWRAKCHLRTESRLRSTTRWYFLSPADTVKNCPTLEFLRIHLAPPSVWL